MALPKGWTPNQSDINSSIQEQIIWKNEITKGIFHKKVVETQTISNLRVRQNDRLYFLHTLDDIIVINQRRESQYHGQRYYYSGSGLSYGTGGSSGKTVGDVAFIYQGKPVIIFRQIYDPSGVCRLAKTAKRSLVSLLKAAEKNQAKIKREKEPKLIKRKDNSVTIGRHSNAKCYKCGGTIPDDSNFCTSCGTKLSSLCSKCNESNPEGSAFCNNCGFPLA